MPIIDINTGYVPCAYDDTIRVYALPAWNLTNIRTGDEAYLRIVVSGTSEAIAVKTGASDVTITPQVSGTPITNQGIVAARAQHILKYKPSHTHIAIQATDAGKSGFLHIHPTDRDQ